MLSIDISRTLFFRFTIFRLSSTATVLCSSCRVVLVFHQSEPLTKFHDGHLVESETYIGGHVECLEVREGAGQRSLVVVGVCIVC